MSGERRAGEAAASGEGGSQNGDKELRLGGQMTGPLDSSGVAPAPVGLCALPLCPCASRPLLAVLDALVCRPPALVGLGQEVGTGEGREVLFPPCQAAEGWLSPYQSSCPVATPCGHLILQAWP